MYDRSTLRDIILDHVVLHPGANDLRTENAASQIATATIDLATSWKNDYKTVNVSGIVPRVLLAVLNIQKPRCI